MSTYTLYHGDDPHTTTDDPKVVIAHAKAKGHRLTMYHTHGIKPLPRLTLPLLKDQPADNVYQELTTSIAKSNRTSFPGEYDKVLGKTDGDGYRLTTTDGHRALMTIGEGERLPAKSARQFTPGPVQFVLNRPFADVWRRMSVLAEGWIDLELTSVALMLSTRDAVGDTAAEFYPLDVPAYRAISIAEPVRFTLNPKYLAPLLRFWPITVAYRAPVDGDTASPLTFSPAGVDWRYIVMSKRWKS